MEKTMPTEVQSQAVVLYSGEDVDQFFAAAPSATEWGWVYANLDKIDMRNPLESIQALEPLKPGDQNEHTIWVQEQILRLALCYSEGKPVKGHTCPSCGTNLADPVLKVCLLCKEWDRQMPYTGSRGSCSYLRPLYDLKSHSWGIVYYWDGEHDGNALLIWVAKGFSSRPMAWLALYPLALYDKWLQRKYLGVGNFCHMYDEIVDVEWLLKNREKIPFDPAGFEVYLRAQIQNHMQQDHNLLHWATSRAISDYERENNE
jgi:hypothetical protein